MGPSEIVSVSYPEGFRVQCSGFVDRCPSSCVQLDTALHDNDL